MKGCCLFGGNHFYFQTEQHRNAAAAAAAATSGIAGNAWNGEHTPTGGRCIIPRH